MEPTQRAGEVPAAVSGVWCVVVAAGSGSRFGGAKQDAVLGDRSVLGHSVGTALASCEGVVVVCRPGSEEATSAAVPEARAVVPGGATRSESSRLGVEAVPAEADVILVHDAARPLAPPELFGRVIEAVRGGADGVVPVVPVTDTVRDLDGDLVDRDGLRAVQTPQGFEASLLRRAVATGDEATDDAALVARVGGRITFVEGDPTNRKLTTPDDLVVAEALLVARREQEAK